MTNQKISTLDGKHLALAQPTLHYVSSTLTLAPGGFSFLHPCRAARPSSGESSPPIRMFKLADRLQAGCIASWTVLQAAAQHSHRPPPAVTLSSPCTALSISHQCNFQHRFARCFEVLLQSLLLYHNLVVVIEDNQGVERWIMTLVRSNAIWPFFFMGMYILYWVSIASQQWCIWV